MLLKAEFQQSNAVVLPIARVIRAAGGIILGVSQAIGAQINPGWQVLAGHLAFLFILAVRPEGLFPKVQA